MSDLPLSSLRLKNFKAIRDSGEIAFTPLTFLVGNNGSGKSSLIEATESLQTLVLTDLDSAMAVWKGFEFIQNRASPRARRKPSKEGTRGYRDPMTFRLKGRASNQGFDCEITISYSTENNRVSFISERVTTSRVYRYTRDVSGRVRTSKKVSAPLRVSLIPPEKSLLQYAFGCGVADWQFVNLDPRAMGEPVLGHQTEARVRLNKDGTNISSYLYDLFTADPGAYNGLLETLQLVLPYAREFRPEVVKGELEQRVFLNLQESTFQLPGWLLSTGTLRILALLALLRHPKAPPLIFIEEIENGLDPRTIGLLVGEIRNAVESGRTQIIATTHSPHLMNLLLLEHIILVDRNENGEPSFTRPATDKELQRWSKNFAPGDLYTMSRMHKPRLETVGKPEEAGSWAEAAKKLTP